MWRIRIGTHPLHPAVVHFPIACWTGVPLTDVGYIVLREPVWWQVSWWLLAIGCLTGLMAMLAGIIDLLTIPAEHAAQATAQRHLLLMASAWTVLLLDLLIRPYAAVPVAWNIWAGFALSVTGWGLILVGAYFGAQLVYQHGVGQTVQHDLP